MTNFVPELAENPAVGRRAALDRGTLGELLLALGTAAGTYIRLSRCFRGWEAAALQRLGREARAQTACVSGIYALVTGDGPEGAAAAPEMGQVGITLRKCYVRAMRILVACEAHSRDPEYGPVFARLAARQQDHCRTLLEIIGKQGR